MRHHLRLYLERIRGVRCSEEQIIITAGIQQSLDYICKILWKNQPTILMEEPGYNKAAAIFISNDLIIQTVPVDKNGLIVSRLLTVQGIGAVYCTPSHQFPTGTVLPIGRRYELTLNIDHFISIERSGSNILMYCYRSFLFQAQRSHHKTCGVRQRCVSTLLGGWGTPQQAERDKLSPASTKGWRAKGYPFPLLAKIILTSVLSLEIMLLLYFSWNEILLLLLQQFIIPIRIYIIRRTEICFTPQHHLI